MEIVFGKPKGKQDLKVAYSKTLSWILRHGAEKEGFSIDKEGYVPLSEILDFKIFRNEKCKPQDIFDIAATCPKQRYQLSDDKTKIRATQGHTISTLDEESLYETIKNPSEIPLVIHGTDKKGWGFIKSQGLNRMARTHIHFAIGYPGDEEVISGMRNACAVIIEVDVPKAMAAGIEFQRSTNGVILSKGFNGVIPPIFFKEVTLREKGKKSVLPIHAYDYALVLDFEATCEDGKDLNCQEIIEFPIVPVNLHTKEILTDKIFSHYVKPEVNPKLSKFCTELTGIEQSTVDAGIPLPDCLKEFDSWMDEQGFTQENSIFVTCGDWDLKQCLPREVSYKSLKTRADLKTWMNIKIFFASVANIRGNKMTQMLADLDLELEGKHHSGIDDSKNIARILIALLKKGSWVTSAFKKTAN